MNKKECVKMDKEQTTEDIRTTQEDLYLSCVKELDSLGQIVFNGCIGEIVNKYKSFGLKGIYLKELRHYIKSVFK
jgi:hypothetical protein